MSNTATTTSRSSDKHQETTMRLRNLFTTDATEENSPITSVNEDGDSQ
jgi:hypothetical protein